MAGRVALRAAIMAPASAQLLAMPSPAHAQEMRVQVAIPAQPLGEALIQFARQTRSQVLYSPGIATGKRSRAVAGAFTPIEALRRLLGGSGLEARRLPSGAIVVSGGTTLQASKPQRPSHPTDMARPPQATLPSKVPETIIVTARRREEVLEHVPQTVNVQMGERLRTLGLYRFEDVAGVVTGLSLLSGSSGTSNTASMRGVTYATETAASPTVEFYLNDTPVSSSFIFQPLFDAGQLEILRGPQGTLRGRAAPSGAITLTTRQPDLRRPGGYLSATGTDRGDINVQGALGLVIVPDKLAIRISGVIDRNDYDGVRSLGNPIRPRQRTWGVRGTARIDPSEDVSTTIMVQHMDANIRSFTHLAGEGSAGIAPTANGYSLPTPISPGFNGPSLTPGDRLGLSENQRRTSEAQTIVTAASEWRFAGQKLAYAGSYARSDRLTLIPADDPNLLPGFDRDLPTTTRSHYWTHELRLGSEVRLAGLLDYVVGLFHNTRDTEVQSERGPTFNAGAFGPPTGAPSPSDAVVRRYGVTTQILRRRDETESSIFGNLTFHLGERTELSAGSRLIIAKRNNVTSFVRNAGGFRLEPWGSTSCEQQIASLYPGFCDIPIPAGQLGSSTIESGTRSPLIYNLQLSHRLGEELTLYANYGTSWRDGPGVIGIINGGNGSDGNPGDPELRQLAIAQPETSKAFEAGAKAVLFDRRLRISAAFYRQKFDGLIYRGLPTAYLADNGFSAPSVARFSFTSNADARVDGFDVELSLRPTRRWDISAAFSYADGRVTNDLIPCNDGNFDGVADAIAPSVAAFKAAGRRVAFCNSRRAVTRSPRWSMTMQSEYRLPVSQSRTAYLRALLNHYPRNANDNEVWPIPSYRTLNLYSGLTDGQWEISLFIKNLLGADRLVSRESNAVQPEANLDAFFGASGYYSVRVVPPRQVGINVRYAFGSQ